MQKIYPILVVFLAFFGTLRSLSAIVEPFAQEQVFCANNMSVAPAIPKPLARKVKTQVIAQISPEPSAIATPKPTTAPVDPQAAIADTPAATEFDHLFEKYAKEYGIQSSVLNIISKCESGHNPQALSASQLYGGLFQFAASTWQSNRRAMGLDDNPDLRFNAEEAIKTAAFKISRDGTGAWPACGAKI